VATYIAGTWLVNTVTDVYKMLDGGCESAVTVKVRVNVIFSDPVILCIFVY